jgi:hypothetical protein
MEGAAFEPGRAVYSAGDAASHFYVAVSGEVGVWEEQGPPPEAHAGGASGGGQRPPGGGSAPGSPTARFSVVSGGGGAAGALLAGAQAQRLASGAGAVGNGSLSGYRGAVRVQAAASPSGSGGCSAAGASRGSATGGGGHSQAGSAASAAAPAFIEVRRLGPGESFGEEDLAPGATRRQTARAISAAGAPSGGARLSRVLTRAATRGGAGGGPPVVVLALGVDEYAKALQGRMSWLQEEKAREWGRLGGLTGCPPPSPLVARSCWCEAPGRAPPLHLSPRPCPGRPPSRWRSFHHCRRCRG